jgi:hypothetical protein
MINIVYYTEVIDNWGRTNSSDKPHIIRDVLKTSDEWTDDMQFEDIGGQMYSIDDLLNKKVCVGGVWFIVKE